MSDIPELVPSATRDVDFYGDQLTAALAQLDGENEPRIFVPLKPICDYLGLDWSSQRRRILRDNVLAGSMVMMTMETAAGSRQVNCLPLDLLPGWLFGVDTNRVSDDLRPKIDRYRRECFRVLWDTFKHDIAGDIVVPRAELSPARLAYELATAVQHLAKQQLEHETRLAELEVSQNRAREWARTVNERLGTLELQLLPQGTISEEQSAELALAVKNVAHRLKEQGETNGYQKVYGELYRRYRISSYKTLRRDRYEEAIAWLSGWYGELEP